MTEGIARYQAPASRRMSWARLSGVICSRPKPTRSVPLWSISSTVLPSSEAFLPTLTGGIAVSLPYRLQFLGGAGQIFDVAVQRGFTQEATHARMRIDPRVGAHEDRRDTPLPSTSSSAPRTWSATRTHVRQLEKRKASTTTFPRYALSDTRRPSWFVRVKSCARAPGGNAAPSKSPLGVVLELGVLELEWEPP